MNNLQSQAPARSQTRALSCIHAAQSFSEDSQGLSRWPGAAYMQSKNGTQVRPIEIERLQGEIAADSRPVVLS
eukprot:6176920-Pleurochrysis_carterae.AAC.3